MAGGTGVALPVEVFLGVAVTLEAYTVLVVGRAMGEGDVVVSGYVS